MTDRILRSATLLLAGLALAATPAAAQHAAKKSGDGPSAPPRALWVDALKFPQLNPIRPADVVRTTLPNGMKLLLIEDRALPKIEFQAYIRGGLVSEQKKGVAEMVGEVLRSGGTASKDGDALDEYLERIGAAIESGSAEDYHNLYAFSLTETLDKVLPLYVELLQAPAFAEKKLELAKTQTRSGIARRNDDAMGLARREFAKIVYGAGSPYAQQIEYADVDAIGREDLVAFHRKFFRPDLVTLAVWGDFDAASMKTRLEAAFGGWKADGPAPQPQGPAVPDPKPSFNFIEKSDVAQSFLFFGHRGVRWDDPDYPALDIMGDILGGGFTSRLFVEIRTKRGLAYASGGAVVPEYDRPGLMFFFTSTKPESTQEATAVMLAELRRIRDGGVTEAELKRAKDAYLNRYAFQYDSKGEIVNRLVTYDFYGYPADFNVRYRNAVEKLTREDIQRAAQKHLRPELLTVLAVGKDKSARAQLASFGELRDIDISIPEPKAAVVVPKATPESLAKGKALLQKAAQARGAALSSVKDVTAEGTLTVQSPMGAMDIAVKQVTAFPDRQHNTLQTPMGAMVQVVAGGEAWMVAGGQVRPLPESAAKEQRGQLVGEFGALLLLQEALAGKREAQYLGAETFEGKPAEAVSVEIDGKPTTYYLDPATAQLLGSRRQGRTQEGPAEIVTVFGDYRESGGVSFPMTTKATANGKPAASSSYTAIKVNSGIDESLFKK